LITAVISFIYAFPYFVLWLSPLLSVKAIGTSLVRSLQVAA